MHDRFEPLSGLAHGIMHPLTELLLNLLQLRPHAFANRLAPHRKPPYPILPADVREAEEIERVGFSFSSAFPVLFSKSTELDPARLVWVQFQSKHPQPLP